MLKNELDGITVACFVLGFLVLLFPMRAGFEERTANYVTSVGAAVNLGPYFILSDPSKLSIYNAIYETYEKKSPNPYSKSRYKSKVDYGRTFILLLLPSAGGLVTFLWSRKISLKDK
jgi:hypothetical protein